MVFLEFEKPLESLFTQLEKLQQVSDEGDIDMSDKIRELENKIKSLQKDIYSNLSGWQNGHGVASSFPLEPHDQVHVYRNPGWEPQRNVAISGEVSCA